MAARALRHRIFFGGGTPAAPSGKPSHHPVASFPSDACDDGPHPPAPVQRRRTRDASEGEVPKGRDQVECARTGIHPRMQIASSAESAILTSTPFAQRAGRPSAQRIFSADPAGARSPVTLHPPTASRRRAFASRRRIGRTTGSHPPGVAARSLRHRSFAGEAQRPRPCTKPRKAPHHLIASFWHPPATTACFTRRTADGDRPHASAEGAGCRLRGIRDTNLDTVFPERTPSPCSRRMVPCPVRASADQPRVTRSTSSGVVTPSRTRRRPSWRSVRIPLSMAARRSSPASRCCSMRARRSSSITSNS